MENYNLIDLGLPSGTLWMDRNVGASSPTDEGLYFAWGETTGYTADEVGKVRFFNWDKYKIGNDAIKHNSKDGLTTLDTIDDAAYQYTEGKCKIPTKEQLQELKDETTSVWVERNGVNGRLFTSKTNGNSIFIPTNGYCLNGMVYGVDSNGNFWGNSAYESNDRKAWCLGFNSSGYGIGIYRCILGLSVRGVAISK